MKELEFMELLSELPPEYIEAAAGPQKPRRTIFRKVYGIPAIAACLVVIIAAAIYPRLRVEKPEQVPEPDQTTYMTTVAETAPYEAEGTASAVTALTDRDVAAEQTVTAAQTAATERTAAGGTRDSEPAQTAASVRQTEQNHAAPAHSGANAGTTARMTAPDKATTRTTVRTTSPARTTARTTAPPKTTTKMTARATVPPITTARVTAGTSAPRAVTTRVTARTTAPRAVTTRVTARTTAYPVLTTAVMATGSEYYFVTSATMRTNVPAGTTMMTAAEGTTTRDGSSGGEHWHPGSPSSDPGSGWHHHGVGGDQDPPDEHGSVPVFFLQAIVPYEADDSLDGQVFFPAIEDGADYILPDEFAGFALPDGMDPAEYNVLRMDYYGYFTDAVVTGAEKPGSDAVVPSICVLEKGSTFRQFTALFWIPKYLDADALFCSANVSVEWDSDSFYSNLPDIGDVLILACRT